MLNPHYKNMGNLYGSEYWTFSLPHRVGEERGRSIMDHRLPLLATEAKELGLVDALAGDTPEEAQAEVARWAKDWVASERLEECLAEKARGLAAAETEKPLEEYRREELERMRLNFYGFDPSYHVARYNFVHKVAPSRTPLYLARHRSLRQRPGDRVRRTA